MKSVNALRASIILIYVLFPGVFEGDGALQGVGTKPIQERKL